jgi:hypothetical protein
VLRHRSGIVTAHSGIVPTDSGIVTSHSGQTLKLTSLYTSLLTPPPGRKIPFTFNDLLRHL